MGHPELVDTPDIIAMRAEVTEAQKDTMVQLVGDILDGKVDPPDETSAFFKKQLFQTQNKHRAAVNRLQLLMKEVAEARMETTRLEGAIEKSADDLLGWLSREAASADDAPEADKG